MRNTGFKLDASPAIVATLYVIGGVQLTFAILPDIDIWFSGLFLDTNQEFWLNNLSPVQSAREAIKTLMYLVFTAGLTCLAVTLLARHGPLRRLRLTSEIIVLGYLLGPGLLANVVLKGLWGRARPAYITEFGGIANFTPPFQITDQCLTNCSFVSGEGSGATAMFLSVVLLTGVVSKRQWALWSWQGGVIVVCGSISLTGIFCGSRWVAIFSPTPSLPFCL
ncbi:phosphatase PAP2 family protein [Tateyamaria sp. SN3-11]|uniref:phosphatase PAP2 family protein n=1 Tax=Tateyamaria sp. SN3-11 TaxID=3092147 RepID=UPI0039EA5508